MFWQDNNNIIVTNFFVAKNMKNDLKKLCFRKQKNRQKNLKKVLKKC